jgi:hypothetical protein
MPGFAGVAECILSVGLGEYRIADTNAAPSITEFSKLRIG